jgi:hypothetical protein
MSLREVRTEIYDENGFVETIVEMVPKIEINIEDQIKVKEDELLRIYDEIQKLKNGNS